MPQPNQRSRRRTSRPPFPAAAVAAGLVLVVLSGLATQAGGSGPVAAEDWWAVRPLRPIPPPDGGNSEHPVDAFLARSRAATGLDAVPQAGPSALLRRATFDLTGLPPTPEEISRFLADWNSDPDAAWVRLVDRLLASPGYGERWARRWLDLAHFAETHGHDQDRVREHAWPYRDYVIAAFNSDRPYARFVREQVAGDVLFPDDPAGIVALGFLGSGPWDESSLRDIREDTLDRQIARYIDRDDILTTVMQTFVSVTVHCARCHDHKFDPVSQADYYALQSVFAGTDKGNRLYDPDPEVFRRRKDLRARRDALARAGPELLEDDAVRERVRRYERAWSVGRSAWTVLGPDELHSRDGASLHVMDDGSVLSGGARPDSDVVTVTGVLPGPTVRALRLEVLPDATLPANGPGRAENGNLHLSRIEIRLVPPDASPAPEDGPPSSHPLPIARASADFEQEGWTIAHAIDTDAGTAWGIHPQEGRPHSAVFILSDPPERIPPGSRLAVTLHQVHGRGHLIGRFRLSVTDATPAIDPGALDPIPDEITAVLEKDGPQRTPDETLRLARHVEERDIARELGELPPEQRVYAASGEFEPDASHRPADSPRPVHLLGRGDILQPKEEAIPGTLSCVSGLAARFQEARDAPSEGARRAALANWLAHPDNPLTWRSIVNRVWQFRFGRGLVETPNDFGQMGAAPSHPELLDWLAVWFRDEAGGSFKALDRLLLTTRTYRLASDGSGSPGAQTIDPDNRLLWRMPRRRLDAECVRDAILAFSGRLDRRMGGPGDRHFDLQPGIHVTPRIDYTAFDPNAPAGRRRSIYRFLFRTLPDPWMEALDCPAGDQLAPVRTNSVTPQQALALWNSAFTTAHADHLGRRLEALGSESGNNPSPAERADHAAILVWGRPPTALEREALVRHAATHGWTSVARVLLNSSAFLFLD